MSSSNETQQGLRENRRGDMAVAVEGGRPSYARSWVRPVEGSLAPRRARRPQAAVSVGAADRPSRLRARVLRVIQSRSPERHRLVQSRPPGAALLASLLIATSVCLAVGAESTGQPAAAESLGESS